MERGGSFFRPCWLSGLMELFLAYIMLGWRIKKGRRKSYLQCEGL